MERLVAVLLSCLALAVTGVNALAQNLLTVGPNGTPDDIRALVAAGADLEARSEGYMTPLMATAANGPLENVRTLLELGADPRATGYQGGTALHHAAVRKDSAAEVTMLLLAAGADVNPRLAEGITPLMQAAGFGAADAIAALTEAGAGLGLGPDLSTEDPDLVIKGDFDLEAFLDEIEQEYEDFDREAFLEEWERSETELATAYEDGFAQGPDAAQLAYERLMEAEQ